MYTTCSAEQYMLDAMLAVSIVLNRLLVRVQRNIQFLCLVRLFGAITWRATCLKEYHDWLEICLDKFFKWITKYFISEWIHFQCLVKNVFSACLQFSLHGKIFLSWNQSKFVSNFESHCNLFIKAKSTRLNNISACLWRTYIQIQTEEKKTNKV